MITRDTASHLGYLAFVRELLTGRACFMIHDDGSNTSEKIFLSIRADSFTSAIDNPFKVAPEISVDITFGWLHRPETTTPTVTLSVLPDVAKPLELRQSSLWRTAFETTDGYSEENLERIRNAQKTLIQDYVLPKINKAGFSCRLSKVWDNEGSNQSPVTHDILWIARIQELRATDS